MIFFVQCKHLQDTAYQEKPGASNSNSNSDSNLSNGGVLNLLIIALGRGVDAAHPQGVPPLQLHPPRGGVELHLPHPLPPPPPLPCGLLLIFLHALTAVGAAAGCAASRGSARWHAAHMAGTVLAAIFQGAVALLAFTRTPDFLAELRSYVREEDAEIILKMVGGLGIAIFVLEWMVLALAFFLRFYAVVEGGADHHEARMRSAKVGNEESLKDWPWPFQV
uniref:Uncharacterized protein n=1 Tax=Ananas comosus var. bracteatus TaxID=296719 RepID=A0A6V7Q7F1_ANACO|nr:unnamed protein product [Ananas comosus var. bracteatus]